MCSLFYLHILIHQISKSHPFMLYEAHIITHVLRIVYLLCANKFSVISLLTRQIFAFGDAKYVCQTFICEAESKIL